MAKYLKLPFLKVFVKPNGVLMFNHREVKRPDDEAWWTDVLYDYRARWPDAVSIERDHPQAEYRLDRQKRRFEIRCPCGQEASMDRDNMIQQVGGSMNVIHLVREWMPCKTRNKLANNCRAYVVR